MTRLQTPISFQMVDEVCQARSVWQIPVHGPRQMKTIIHHSLLWCTAASCLAAVGCSAELGSGRAAPDFRLDSLAGQSVTLSQYKGNVVLLNFWAMG